MEASPRLLSCHNLQRLLNEIGVLYEPVHPQQLAGRFASILRRLIPGEFYGVSIVDRSDPSSDRTRRQTSMFPLPANWDHLAATFADQYARFPLRPIRESGNLHHPLALSDIVSRRHVENLGLYHDYYRVLGIADDLSVNFGNLRHRLCLAILRKRRGFSDQDRAILGVLRPHMERAYRYARMFNSLGMPPGNQFEPAGLTRPVGGAPVIHYKKARSLCVLGLSEREAEVLYWVAEGKSSPVIGTILGIRHDTVRTHLKRIFAKLGVENRFSAALRALQVLKLDYP